MNLDVFVPGLLVFARLIFAVVLAEASVRNTDGFYEAQTVAWKIDGETSDSTIQERATENLVDRTNTVINPDTSVKPVLSTKLYHEEDTFTTLPYADHSVTPDADIVRESVTRSATEALRGADFIPTEISGTTQNDVTTISDTTESTTINGTTFPYTETTITSTPPYCPTDLEPKLIGVTSTTISLEWLPLGDPDGFYSVKVHSDGPAYEIPSYCSPDKGKDSQMTTTKDSITYSEALPKYTYNISITGTTKCGTPAEGGLLVTTLPTIPEAPEMRPVVQDKAKTIFYFSLPCNMNGVPDYFSLSFQGHSLYDSSEDRGMKNVSAKGNLDMYNITENMRLAFNYSAKVSLVIENGLEGPASEVNFTTPEDVPGKPKIIEIDTSSTVIDVFWKGPEEHAGHDILAYELVINPIGPLYPVWLNCNYDHEPKHFTLSGNDTSYSFMEADPYYEYQLLLRACSSLGCGKYTEETAYTKESAPENVEDVKVTIIPPTQVIYNEKAQIQFKSCRPNGNRSVYTITMHSSPNDGDGINENYTDTIDHGLHEATLQPEYRYWFMITIDNGYSKNQTSWYFFNSTAGVPAISSNTMVVLREGNTVAEVTLIKGYLNESNGKILYIALILSDENVTNGDFSQWNGRQWPAVRNPGVGMYYQITDDWWNPFEDKNEAKFTIGSGSVRNKPLVPDKGYYLIVRLFTSSFYRNSEVIYFKTGDGFTIGVVLGVAVGVLLTLTIFTVLYFIMRRRTLTARTRPADAQRDLKKDDTLYKFIEYCKALEEDPDQLSSQFEAITSRGKEIVSERTSSFARLPENWRKNRYVNILPYDDTRVKLLIDEDDEIGSDYINASYIEGYTGKTEYIATQGPLLKTCRDFWKMVLQENVHVIVMVSQFIVNKKEKCFKYFPEKGKTMIIGDDMEIRCTTELHFGTYCVRTIQVKKGKVQASVTHMQFLEWPDFGVPVGTEHMLQFCYQVRRRVNQEGGCVIVHCSAGVGRTGTFIATDILLQKANEGKPLDVFETVMRLREQRTLMVQTEEQYNYIYKLIRSHLEEPPGDELEDENSEHIYENISVIQNDEGSSDKIILESEF